MSSLRELKSRPKIISYSSHYEFDHAVELKFHEDQLSLSPDSFHVSRMDNGENLFYLSASISGSHKKVLHDSLDHTSIYSMKLTRLHHQNNIQILDAKNDQVAFTVKNVENHDRFDKETIQIWKGSNVTEAPAMIVEGNFTQKRFRIWNIVQNDFTPAAVIRKRKFTLEHLFSIRDTLLITVEKDVDAALVTMLVAIVTEQWHKSH